MITEADSGFPTAVYNAINAGGLDTELRVTSYPAELFPPGTTNIALHSALTDVIKLEQVDSTRYCAIFNGGAFKVITSSATATWYADQVVDFYFDGTHIWIFRSVAGVLTRYQHTPSSSTPVSTSAVYTIGSPWPTAIACADANNVFFFKITTNNNNLTKRTFSGGVWTETTSDIWMFGAGELRAVTKANGDFMLVWRAVIPAEKFTKKYGTSTYYYVGSCVQYLSYIWGQPSVNVIYEYNPPSDQIEYYVTLLGQLNKFGDQYVLSIPQIADDDHPYTNPCPVGLTISADGIYWSELISIDSDFNNSARFSDLAVYPPLYPGGPTGLKTIPFPDIPPCIGKSFAGAPLYYDSSQNLNVKLVPKSVRLYGYANADAGTDITSLINNGKWEFERTSTTQINLECTADIGYVLLRHELGHLVSGVMYWFTYATTIVDNITSSYTVADGKTTYRVATRDLMAFMIDKFQSYTSREWNGHQASIEYFGDKSITKLAVTSGTLDWIDSSPDYGRFTPPTAGRQRGHAYITGVEDKRNHCQTYYCEPENGSAFLHLFAIHHPEVGASTGVFLNVTTANIQLRGWHNGVNVMNPSAITVANAKYFRIQLHYGLLRIYYSTNNTTWTKVDYPLDYTGMSLSEFYDRPFDTAPWALSFPGIGTFASTSKFYQVVNTNRNPPIRMGEALKIAGAFATLNNVKVYGTAPTGGVPIGGAGVYIKGVRAGTSSAGFGYAILDSINLGESGGKYIIKWQGGGAIQTSADAPATNIAFFITAFYVSSDGAINYIGTLWNGNEIVTAYYRTTLTPIRSEYDYLPHDVAITAEPSGIPAWVSTLTIDVGETPEQGLSRALEGREHLTYFIRPTGELAIKIKVWGGGDTNLIQHWTEKTESGNYADNHLRRRKVTAVREEEKRIDGGIEGTFAVEQNTMIENPLEYPYVVIGGDGKEISYNCFIPIFQEVFDAIENQFPITRISGSIQNGKLSGSIAIGNEKAI